jgi:hypothetical protein
LSLSLLAPASLALLALGILPVLAHLTRQRPTERVAFGAMLLIQRLVKRLRRRRTLKDRLLLLLRALAVLLLALAAAGPQLLTPGDIPEYGGSGRVVLVVDRSMSMRLIDGGASLLSRARGLASKRVSSLPPGTKVGLITYADEAEPLTTELIDDHERVSNLIARIEPSRGSSNLKDALLEARRMLEGEPGEVLLFTDEAGPTMVPSANEELARLVDAGSAVLPQVVHAEPPRNVAVVRATYGDGLEGGQVVVRLVNYGPDPLEVPCEVELPDGARIPVFVDLPPEGEAEARVTIPREALGGVGEVHCDDPDLPGDDRRYFHLPRVGASRVLVVDGDPGDTPTASEVYFLERALAPWGGVKSGVTPDVISPAGLSALDPDEHRVVFLANVSDPRPVGAHLRDFVRRGGALVISAGDNVTADRYNAALGPLLPSPLRKPRSLADRAEDPVPLRLPDLDLELFSPFSRAGRGGFTRIGAWRVLTFTPYTDGGDVRTLLSFEGGAPALVERTFGSGRVLVWTSSMDLAWSNLPLQATFMPLIQRMVETLGAGGSSRVGRVDALLGTQVRVPLEDIDGALEVRGPTGLVRSTVEGSSVVFSPEEPGGYEVALAGGPSVAWVAVNVDGAESDVRRSHSVAEAESELDPELFVRRTDLGSPALALGLLLALGSALLAVLGGP